MLEIYLVSLVVGGIFVLLSAIGGSHGHSDGDAPALEAHGVDGPDVHVDGPDVHVDGPDVHVDGPDVHVDGPDVHVDGDTELHADGDGDLHADGDADLHAHEVHLDKGALGPIDKGALAPLDKDGLQKDVATQALWLPFLSFRFWTFLSAFFGLTGTSLTLLWGGSAALTLGLSLGVGLVSGTGIAWAMHKLTQTQVDSSIKLPELIGAKARVTLRVDREGKGTIELEHRNQVLTLVAATDEREPLLKGDVAVIIGFEGDIAQIVREARLLRG